MPNDTYNGGAVREPSREIPVLGRFDVIVVGGGIAGVAAAVAAARNSVSVCLIEKHCALGGLATLGNVTMWLPLCDGHGNQVISGLGEELLKLSVSDNRKNNTSARFLDIPPCWRPDGNRKERSHTRYQVDFNPASYLFVLEKLVMDTGITLLYDTRFCSVIRKGNKISHVILENKSGRSAMECGVVIDATGDADVCFTAGEKTVSLDSNVLAGWFYTFTAGELKMHHLSNKYCPVGSTKDSTGPFFRGDEARQVTAHICQTRTLIREKISKLRVDSPHEDVELIMPPTIACLRMTRRLAGRFTLAGKYVHQWFVDTIGLTGDWRCPGPVYAIPLGCLHGTTGNLLTAGRCISVDNTAWDVTRAIPPCVVTGQAAGTVGAIAVSQTEGIVGSVDYGIVKDRLLNDGVLIDSKLLKR